MRTQKEVEDALAILLRYRKDQRRKTIDLNTKMNLLGVEAALEWFLGDDNGPVADNLRELPGILGG